ARLRHPDAGTWPPLDRPLARARSRNARAEKFSRRRARASSQGRDASSPLRARGGRLRHFAAPDQRPALLDGDADAADAGQFRASRRTRPHVAGIFRRIRILHAAPEGFGVPVSPASRRGADGGPLHQAPERPYAWRKAVARGRQARQEIRKEHDLARLAAEPFAAISRREDCVHARAGCGGVSGVVRYYGANATSNLTLF